MRNFMNAGLPWLVVVVYGTAMVLFISVVCSKWYPVLQAKLNPTFVTWVFKVLLHGVAAFVGYLYAHRYLNTITGVDPNNFPKTLLAFTVPFTLYIWLVYIALAAILVCVWYWLWMIGVIALNALVSAGQTVFFVGRVLVQCCTYVFCTGREFLKTSPDYAGCNERFLAFLAEVRRSKSTRPRWVQRIDLKGRTFLIYTLGPIGIFICAVGIEQLPQHPPLDRVIHRAAAFILVRADFAYDKTCSASSDTHWVAPLKDRKEQDSPKVLIADLSMWPEIQFSFGACK
jgi:hypothetical protein